MAAVDPMNPGTPDSPQPPPAAADAPAMATILIVGPDQARIDALARRLSPQGLSCETALASPASLRGGLLHAPDVVVAIEMEGSWQPTRRLLEMDLARLPGAAAPVLVVSEGVGDAERADALASPGSGVWDWVDRSCPDREIAARLLRLARLRRMGIELEDLRRRCAGLETVDRLTGLPNHRAFQDYLSAEFRRAERYGSPLSLMILDIDHFRSLNDALGHLQGDRILQAIARALRSVVRGADMAARYGGEEFALLLPETDAASALAVADRVRAALEEAGTQSAADGAAAGATAGEGPARVTLSAGLATFPDQGTATRGLLLAAAESALARAKDEGRSRVVAHAAGAPAPPRRQVRAASSAAGAGGGSGPGAGGGAGWSG